MRHRKDTAKLGRTSSHRKALLRNMVTSLLEHERIETTHAKARQVRRTAERLITLGKRGGLSARRRALRTIRSREVAAKVFDDLAERYRDRPGGYTRVIKLGSRAGDAAALSLVELVEARTEAPARSPSTAAKRPRGEPAAAKGASAARGAGKKASKAKAEEKPRPRRKAKVASAKAVKGEKPTKRASASAGKAAKKKKAKTSKAGSKKTSRKKSS